MDRANFELEVRSAVLSSSENVERAIENIMKKFDRHNTDVLEYMLKLKQGI